MKLNKYDLKYREFLKLERRSRELNKLLRDVKWKKLDQPYQKGWLVFYDLREDIKRRSDAAFLKMVLEVGWNTSHTRFVNHVKAMRSGKKAIKGRKGKMLDLTPSRNLISKERYEGLHPAVQKYFFLDKYSDTYKIWGKELYYAAVPHYWIILKCRANMITHISAKGGILEQEQDEIDNKLQMFWITMFGGYGRSYPKGHDRTKTRNKIRGFMNGDLDDVINEKVPLEYEY